MHNQALEFIGSYAPKTQGRRSPANELMKPRVFIILIAASALSGCHCPPQVGDPFAITPEERHALDNITVVLPETTPYDGKDSRRRQAYLESYAESYRQHSVGWQSSFRHENGSDPLADAKMRGWHQAQVDVQTHREGEQPPRPYPSKAADGLTVNGQE